MHTFLLVVLLFVCTVYTKPYKRSAVSTDESYNDFIAIQNAIGSSSSDVISSDDTDSSSDDHGRHGNNEIAHGHGGHVHKETAHKKSGKRQKRSTQGGERMDSGINEATFAILCDGDDWNSVDCSDSHSTSSKSPSTDEWLDGIWSS